MILIENWVGIPHGGCIILTISIHTSNKMSLEAMSLESRAAMPRMEQPNLVAGIAKIGPNSP